MTPMNNPDGESRQLTLITHEIDNTLIYQRAADGYVNATAMCQASGKMFGHYNASSATQEFLRELSSDIGIPISGMVIPIKGGTPALQGTWVHPDVAVHLAQWCSAKFAVAVSRWVREWVEGRAKGSSLPYHLRRYIANRDAVPHTHFSMLNEMIIGLIGPLESQGYILPEKLLPDISEGQMFCRWLRDEMGVDTDALPRYEHKFADGRIVTAKLYPNSVLPAFKKHFHEVWLPKRAMDYFRDRDVKALPFLPKLLPPPEA